MEPHTGNAQPREQDSNGSLLRHALACPAVAKSFLGDVLNLASPYFGSEEKRFSWTVLASVIVLSLTSVQLLVILNYWQSEFFNAIQEKDYQAFLDLILTWRPIKEHGIFAVFHITPQQVGLPEQPADYMPGFCSMAVVYITVNVYAVYLTQWLQIKWRRAMTAEFLDHWLADLAFFIITVTHKPGAIGTENPDQRIAEDLREFINMTIKLTVEFIANMATFLSFIAILWSVSGPITLFGITIPGYMVVVALVYSVVGTGLTHFIGRALPKLRFHQQRLEADFRFALMRIRENAEAVALSHGEAVEKGSLNQGFSRLYENWRGIMWCTKKLNTLTTAYGQVADVFPYLVAAPRYFAGAITLGVYMQISNAFGRVQGALSWFVTSYASLADYHAVVQRLITFKRAIAIARAAKAAGIIVEDKADNAVRIRDLTVELPDGVQVLANENVTFKSGTSVVVTGASGGGKSTFFHAIAGIWPFGHGRVERPANCMFLPQRSYMPLGTLREAVTYPHEGDFYSLATILQALTDAGLPEFSAELDVADNWGQRLSGGQQQRVALVRALLAQPEWLFLDEATASLDPASEGDFYQTLKKRLPNTTIVSIAHRPDVAAIHDRRIVMQCSEDGGAATLV